YRRRNTAGDRAPGDHQRGPGAAILRGCALAECRARRSGRVAMSYLMSHREDQKRSLIDAQTLIAALGRQWPAANVSTFSPAERVYVVEWRMTLSHGLLLGGFSRNGQAISLDGALEDCAEVALWFRTLIAADTRLW